jgi:peptide/nickel transport system permease protein
VIVDPRIHLLPERGGTQSRVKAKSSGMSWLTGLKISTWKKRPRKSEPVYSPVRTSRVSWAVSSGRFIESIRGFGKWSRSFFQELRKYPSAIFGLTVILIMFAGSVYAVLWLPYEQYGREYGTDRVAGRNFSPRVAAPEWTNLFSATPRLSTMILDESSPQTQVNTKLLDNGWVEKTITFTFDYAYREIPDEIFLYFDALYDEKFPFVTLTWITPDGRSIDLNAASVAGDIAYDFEGGVPAFRLTTQYPQWKEWFISDTNYPTPAFKLLFAKPDSTQPDPQHGNYQLEIKSLLFEEGSDLHPQLVLLGQVSGVAGTDYWRRDLIVPLLWGMPFALLIGLFGTLIMLLVAMLLPAIGVWFGGWLDDLIQRLTEINMILPGLTIAVLANALFGINIWIILGVIVVINAFGAPIKTFRSALLQAREAPYIESARAFGAGNFRIITHYLIPRILPVVIPQLVTQVPSFIFLEATLGFFNIKSNYPSWGKIIYEGLSRGALYGSPFWVLAPISLLLLTGFAFTMLGSVLERILNPRMLD